MTRVRMIQTALLGTATLLAATAVAQAQSTGASGLSSFQGGYGNARSTITSNTTGSTRDENGNRLIVDGIIQTGVSSYASSSSGVSSSWAGVGSSSSSGGTTIGGATAIGNNLNVVVQGNHNTVIVNSRQTNNGNITAGTVLNGTLNLGN